MGTLRKKFAVENVFYQIDRVTHGSYKIQISCNIKNDADMLPSSILAQSGVRQIDTGHGCLRSTRLKHSFALDL